MQVVEQYNLLRGKRLLPAALVVGGASGLGEATARMLHERGAAVTVADVNADKAAALAPLLAHDKAFEFRNVDDLLRRKVKP